MCGPVTVLHMGRGGFDRGGRSCRERPAALYPLALGSVDVEGVARCRWIGSASAYATGSELLDCEQQRALIVGELAAAELRAIELRAIRCGRGDEMALLLARTREAADGLPTTLAQMRERWAGMQERLRQQAGPGPPDGPFLAPEGGQDGRRVRRVTRRRAARA